MDTGAGAGDLVVVGPHGTRVTHAGPRRRRILEHDRHGTALAALRWSEAGALLSARVRIQDGTWLEIEPRATGDAPWGLSDRLWHDGRPLTVFAAIDYGTITVVPPLAEPARLPPGAGTAVLNLIAALAADQGAPRLTYGGPYPTESLFLALLESFRYEPPAGKVPPLEAFTAGGLAWRPAPHARLFGPDGVYVQLRNGVEKVSWQGRTYYRPRWQEVVRRAPRRIRDDGETVVCSLHVLDRDLEDHLRLSPDGEVLELTPPSPCPAAVDPVPVPIVAGIVAIVAAGSAPALSRSIHELGPALHVEWGPVTRDLLRIDGPTIRLSTRIPSIARTHLTAAPTKEARAAAALAILSELAALIGDHLRSRAQSLLSQKPAPTQHAALHHDPDPDPTPARTIVTAVEALISGHGLPDPTS